MRPVSVPYDTHQGASTHGVRALSDELLSAVIYPC
jgi:hypothetical protein